MEPELGTGSTAVHNRLTHNSSINIDEDEWILPTTHRPFKTSPRLFHARKQATNRDFMRVGWQFRVFSMFYSGGRPSHLKQRSSLLPSNTINAFLWNETLTFTQQKVVICSLNWSWDKMHHNLLLLWLITLAEQFPVGNPGVYFIYCFYFLLLNFTTKGNWFSPSLMIQCLQISTLVFKTVL